jgi:hypothetical protein
MSWKFWWLLAAFAIVLAYFDKKDNLLFFAVLFTLITVTKLSLYLIEELRNG